MELKQNSKDFMSTLKTSNGVFTVSLQKDSSTSESKVQSYSPQTSAAGDLCVKGLVLKCLFAKAQKYSRAEHICDLLVCYKPSGRHHTEENCFYFGTTKTLQDVKSPSKALLPLAPPLPPLLIEISTFLFD